MLHDNLIFGAPGQVVAKLKLHEFLDIDPFTYDANLGRGLGLTEQKRSLTLFVEDILPTFA